MIPQDSQDCGAESDAKQAAGQARKTPTCTVTLVVAPGTIWQVSYIRCVDSQLALHPEDA